MTSLIVVIIPGTGVIYTVSVALGRGSRAGAIAAFGCTLGIVPHIVAAAFGLSAFLHAERSPFAFSNTPVSRTCSSSPTR